MQKTFVDLQANLLQLRQGIALAIATQKRIERQTHTAESQAEEWYCRAELALQQGHESLAREALTKRHSYQQTTLALSSQIEASQAVTTQLKQDLRTLELKISELKTKKDLYIARSRSAEATYRLQEMLSGVKDLSGLNPWEQMEAKICQIEAQSEVLAQIGSDNLETKISALATIDDVEVELSRMKTKHF
jgi:phage shock protein A